MLAGLELHERGPVVDPELGKRGPHVSQHRSIVRAGVTAGRAMAEQLPLDEELLVHLETANESYRGAVERLVLGGAGARPGNVGPGEVVGRRDRRSGGQGSCVRVGEDITQRGADDARASEGRIRRGGGHGGGRDDTVSTGLLGAVERSIRRGQQGLRGASIGRPHRDAKAGRQGNACPLEDEPVLLDADAKALGRLNGPVFIEPRKDHHELLPSEARGLVALAEVLGMRRRAQERNAASPAGWPKVSLSFLKWSRSRITRPMTARSSRRSSLPIAATSSSLNARRL